MYEIWIRSVYDHTEPPVYKMYVSGRDLQSLLTLVDVLARGVSTNMQVTLYKPENIGSLIFIYSRGGQVGGSQEDTRE